MGSMIIDGIRVEFTDETNVLTVIRNAGIDLPTLCYVSELSVYGACRLCTVKDDEGRYFASCTVRPRDGMNIQTNTPELRQYRRTLLELLLASHDRDCTVCNKNGDCHLQNLAERMGVRNIRFKSAQEHHEVDNSSNCIVRTPSKCILYVYLFACACATTFSPWTPSTSPARAWPLWSLPPTTAASPKPTA